MIDDPKIFGVMLEWKTEQPLIMEGVPMTYDQAVARMKSMCSDPKVIRAAVFEMKYADGNETLIPKESGGL